MSRTSTRAASSSSAPDRCSSPAAWARRTRVRSSTRAPWQWASAPRSPARTMQRASSLPSSGDRFLGFGHDVDELAGGLVLEDQLATTVGHLLLFDEGLAVVLAPGARDPLDAAAAPVFQLHRLPLAGLGRRVARIHHRVDDVAVIERLHRLPARVERGEHVLEHVDVAQLAHLVADRKEPAGRGLCFLGDIAAALAGREHLEAGAKEVIRPDRALGAGDLVAQVHAAAERPGDLELPDRARLELDQRNRIVLRLDRVDERVRPCEHLDGAVLLAHEVADDLDAVTAQVDDRAASRLLSVPEPRRMRAGMRLARTRPGHLADLPRLDGLDRLQRLRRIDEVLEVAGEDSGTLDGVEHPLCLRGVACQRLRTEDGL